MPAGSLHNTINPPVSHMNGCLMYQLSNKNVANSQRQGTVKSNPKNQMSSKQIPYIFFIFHKQDSSTVYGNCIFPPCASSFLGRLLPPCPLASLPPFLGFIPHVKGRPKAASRAALKDAGLGRSRMHVFFWEWSS